MGGRLLLNGTHAWPGDTEKASWGYAQGLPQLELHSKLSPPPPKLASLRLPEGAQPLPSVCCGGGRPGLGH